MSNKYYTRTNGEKILISKMATPHIENALNKLQARPHYISIDEHYYINPEQLQQISWLQDELISRRKTPPRLKLQELFRCNIAGVQYSDYQLAKLSLKPGARLKLWWERSNPHDNMAIRVELNGVKLGYIPRHGEHLVMRDYLHLLREQGNKVICTLVSYNPTNPTWNMFTIKCEAKIPVSEVKEKDTEL